MSAVLSRITIFPIKSLDGIDVPAVQVLAGGALENDRRFALLDAGGRYVTGKRTAAIHRIRTVYDLEQMTVRLNQAAELSLLHERSEIGRMLSRLLGIACGLVENPYEGFPDDTSAPGPTLVSTATLDQVTTWFPNLRLAETRRRFRANLEVAGVEPFWEDGLVGSGLGEVPFQIGDLRWLGVNPCQRCVVPTRDAATSEPTHGFQHIFSSARKSQLPAWAPRDRFDHFYRLAVNTRFAADQGPGRIEVGDSVSVD